MVYKVGDRVVAFDLGSNALRGTVKAVYHTDRGFNLYDVTLDKADMVAYNRTKFDIQLESEYDKE